MIHYAIVKQQDYDPAIPIWENPQAEHASGLDELYELINAICGRNPIAANPSVSRHLRRHGHVYIMGHRPQPSVRIARVP